MSNDERLAEDDFEEVARLHCHRWEARSLKAVRALLVDGERLADVAKEFGMRPQQVNVLRSRFLEAMGRAGVVKITAEQFMQKVTPATSVLEPFKKDIKQLTKAGYSESQIAEFLHENKVKVSAEELKSFLGAIYENASPSKSKRRGG